MYTKETRSARQDTYTGPSGQCTQIHGNQAKHELSHCLLTSARTTKLVCSTDGRTKAQEGNATAPDAFQIDCKAAFQTSFKADYSERFSLPRACREKVRRRGSRRRPAECGPRSISKLRKLPYSTLSASADLASLSRTLNWSCTRAPVWTAYLSNGARLVRLTNCSRVVCTSTIPGGEGPGRALES